MQPNQSYSQQASILQLVCNYDVQHAVRKYCLANCCSREKQQTNYCDWVARLLQSIDAVVIGNGQIMSDEDAQKLEKQTNKRAPDSKLHNEALMERYAMPAHWLPLASSLGTMLDQLGESEVQNQKVESRVTSLVREALNAMYSSNEEQRRTVLLDELCDLCDSLERMLEDTTDRLPQDMWMNVKRDLMGHLEFVINGAEYLGFKRLIFTNREAAFKQALVALNKELHRIEKEGVGDGQELTAALREAQRKLKEVQENWDKKRPKQSRTKSTMTARTDSDAPSGKVNDKSHARNKKDS